MRNFVVKSIFALMIVQSHSAIAANTIVQLGTPKKSPIKSIGVVPVKKHVPLQLGDIREDAAELPIISTVESRMKKRLQLARQRQRSVGSAKRSTHNEGQLRRPTKPKPQKPFESNGSNTRTNDEVPEGALKQPSPFDN